MGDSRKWAAEREEEEYLASEQGKKDAETTRCWNRLVKDLQHVRIGRLKVRDLRFVLEAREVFFPSSRAKEEDVDRLMRIMDEL